MKTTGRIVLCVMIIAQTIKSQNNNHKIYLEGGICGGAQQNNAVSGVAGAVGFFVNKNSSVDIRVREVYNFSNRNIVGPITFNYRYNFNFGLFAGGGFAHHHEVGERTYTTHAGEAIMGSHPGIFHRSGLSLEAGYNFKPFAKKGFFSGIYPAANICFTKMLNDGGADPLITAGIGIKIGIKKFPEK